jgi:two-component sensor histidine kinase
VLAPLGRDAELARRVLMEAGLHCRLCHSVDDLHAQPADSYGTVLLTEEVLTEGNVRMLTALLDAQPVWSNLPVTILTGRSSGRMGPIRRSLAETLGSRRGIIVLERPVRVATFVSIMRSALLARQRQYELRDQLAARQKAEAHAQMLTEEMKHRIKNSLGLIGAIAVQTFRHERPMEDSLEAFSARLRSMALAQDVLTQESGDGAFIHQLVSQALEPYLQHDVPGRIMILGSSDARIGGRGSTPLIMAMHELATNAVKYGALSVDAGRVTVSWRIEEVSGVRHLHIEWRELGGPSVTPPEKRGFGSRLVERGLAMELGGKARITFRPEGVVCEITAPLEGGMGK